MSRKEVHTIIQQQVRPGRKVHTIPFGLVASTAPLARLFSKNLYDKLAFMLEVIRQDTIAPEIGESRLEACLREKAGAGSPANVPANA